MRFLLATVLLLSALGAFAQVDLSYFIPAHQTFNKRIPHPAEVLGFQVGEKHVRHDQMVRYAEKIASLSERVHIDTIGYTYENRPLIHMIYTSPENHARLEEIRLEHKQLFDGVPLNKPLSEMPVVVWMGYSIHGNEPSGGNASLLVMYELAASQSPEIEQMLDNMVILIEPCFNPDGFDRFASWANVYKGIQVINTDPNSREHNEVWPGGRTNHYWFDLNRDWLLVQHPESQARIRQYHRWKPNLLTDHHEMGTNSSFFFQPGIPSRNHPLTPENTFTLTNRLAEFHAAALDEIGSLYYTRESYDDFYYGKGSTYPDLNGGVGILFEQASSRGQAQKRTDETTITFPFTIRNQYTTSFSSLRGALSLKNDFLEHQQNFYARVGAARANNPHTAYVWGEESDPERSATLARILMQHDIQVHRLTAPFQQGSHTFPAGHGYVVKLNQAQYRLIISIFERRTQFVDSLFYDVSAWTLPLAFNLPDAAISSAKLSQLQLEPLSKDFETLFPMESEPGRSAEKGYAFVMDWANYYAPAVLDKVLQAGLLAKVASQKFSDRTTGLSFSPGSILIPLENQLLSPTEITELLQRLSTEYKVQISRLSSGNTSGVSLGSNAFRAIPRPRLLLVAGEGSRSYEVGEVWHLLDQRYQIDISLVDADRLTRMDLGAYTTIIMVDGNYHSIAGLGSQLEEWVKNGGTIVAWKRALSFLHATNVATILPATPPVNLGTNALVQLPFEDRSNRSGAQAIGGAIVQGKMDLSHPLCYGYQREEIPLFRNGAVFLAPASSPYRNPILYTAAPLLSGYLSSPNQAKLANTAAAVISPSGKGRVVALADNPNFRAYWYGTNRLMMNGIFFGFMMN